MLINVHCPDQTDKKKTLSYIVYPISHDMKKVFAKSVYKTFSVFHCSVAVWPFSGKFGFDLETNAMQNSMRTSEATFWSLLLHVSHATLCI